MGAVALPVVAQESIQDAREQRESARSEQLAAQAEIDVLAAEDIEVRAALDAATELVGLQQARVDAAQQQLQQAIATQRQSEIAVDWALADLAALRNEAQAFAVRAYLQADRDPTAVLLGAADVNEGIKKIALLDAVSANAADVIDQLRTAEDEHEASVERASFAVDEVAVIDAELSSELAVLEEERSKHAAIKAELDGRIAEWEAKLAEFEGEEQELTDFILAQQARVLGVGVTVDLSSISTDGYVWPTGGGVASGFGSRLHPVLGYYRMHSGLDIGGAMGQPIFAAKGGTVIRAGWNGGYGNSVIIDHGGGVTTLYAHQSQLEAAVGQTVSRGDIIGQVGSTGLSTGPHLHFEVRVNGVAVDPLQFMP
jgi:murein DD-endopeptidase MepM/ murein hydrolase activator NlpD